MSNEQATALALRAEKLFNSGDLLQAQGLLEELLALNPRDPVVLTNLGYTEHLLGQQENALKHCLAAVDIDPDSAAALENLGAVHMHQQQFPEAKAAFERGIMIKPDQASLHTALGLVHLQYNQFSEALNCHMRAIEIDPRCTRAYCNLGITRLHCGQAVYAIDNFYMALDLQPGYKIARSNLLLALQYLPGLSVRETHLAFEKCLASFPERKTYQSHQKRNKSLRVGFVSSDFNKHPVGYFLQALFTESRDDNYQFYCYSNSGKADSVTALIKSHANKWRQIEALSDQDASSVIREDQIDVLVDLNGHTEGNRLELFALRPAPAQVSWLGYFASTGLPFIDYVLLNKDQATQGTEKFYCEKIHGLHSCQFNYLPPTDLEVDEAISIEHGSILFASFNNLAKLNADVISTWSKLLHAMPAAQLKLKWRSLADIQVQEDILHRFAQHNIDPERLILSPATEHARMLQEYREVDIALDTFPFSGALTSCEALWMGVPVVSMRQLRPVSRQTWSILKTLSLEDLCVETPAAYIETAVALAQDIERRQILRKSLREQLLDCTRQQGASLSRELKAFFLRCKNEIP